MMYEAAQQLVKAIAASRAPHTINHYAASLPMEPRTGKVAPHEQRRQRLVDWLTHPPASLRMILVTEAAGSHAHWRTGIPMVGQHMLESDFLPALIEREMSESASTQTEPSDQDTPSILLWRAVNQIGALPFTMTWTLMPLLPVEEVQEGVPLDLRPPTEEEINHYWQYAELIAASHPHAIWIPTSHRTEQELRRFAMNGAGIRTDQVVSIPMSAWSAGDRLLEELGRVYKQAVEGRNHASPPYR